MNTPPRVLNQKHLPKGLPPSLNYHAYVGRQRSHFHFGNPFSHLNETLATVRVPTREDSITAYISWLDGTAHQTIEPERRRWILKNLHTLRGKDLICWCAPLPCHADHLLKLANQETPHATNRTHNP